MTLLNVPEVVRQLEGRIARQRQEGGSILDYGDPDPLDVMLLAHFKHELRRLPQSNAKDPGLR